MRALALLQRIEGKRIGKQQVGTVLTGAAAIELALQPLRVQLAGACRGERCAGKQANVPTTQAISKPARRSASTVAASAHAGPPAE